MEETIEPILIGGLFWICYQTYLSRRSLEKIEQCLTGIKDKQSEMSFSEELRKIRMSLREIERKTG